MLMLMLSFFLLSLRHVGRLVSHAFVAMGRRLPSWDAYCFAIAFHQDNDGWGRRLSEAERGYPEAAGV